MDDRACGRFQLRVHRRAALWLAAATLAILTLFVPHGAAQERHNFLSVGGSILDDAGPYYFIAYGDSGNAFARAAPFAEAMGLTLDDDGATATFRNGARAATIEVESDVAAGLERRDVALRVDGQAFARPVPSGIRTGGDLFVPITPLAEAFGADADWFADARVIDVSLPRALANGTVLRDPRIGRHDGFTRVALDVPDGQAVEVRVGDGNVALAFPGAELTPVDRMLDEGPLIRLHSDEADGDPVLILTVDHEVGADGSGYRLGRTEGGSVYLDVGADLSGAEAAGRLPDAQAPPPAPAPTALAPEGRRQVVVLDAGHGGRDPGTVSPWAREKEVVLAVTLEVADRLRAAGVEVILTRDRDEFLTLQERSNYATTDQNLFVSIHANAAANPAARGIETWVFGRPLDPRLVSQAIRENGGGDVGAARTAEAAESANIAGDILRETQLNYSMNLAQRVQARLVERTGAVDRGVRQNLFYVLRNSRIPAILIEVGFVSNYDEGHRLMQRDYQHTLADAIADGLLDFLQAGGSVAAR